MCPDSIYFGLDVVPIQVLWAKYILFEYADPQGKVVCLLQRSMSEVPDSQAPGFPVRRHTAQQCSDNIGPCEWRQDTSWTCKGIPDQNLFVCLCWLE